jgi:hypothetical protein
MQAIRSAMAFGLGRHAAEELDKAVFGAGPDRRMVLLRVVDEVILVLGRMGVVIGLVGLARGADLLGRPGQPDHPLVQIGGEIADHLGRVALGIDTR